MDIQQIVLNLIQNNPNIQKNEYTQNLIDVIKSGDSTKGEELANNILKSYGLTKEQGLNIGKQFFKF